jgi:serine/threonine-protein kinase
MVMEYLDGGDLAAWLQERGTLPIEQAVEFVLQASEAIAEAHALGIVHRDLKPANLFCIRRADGRLSIKVLDFGISKMTQFGSSGPNAMTHAGALMGSPLYMSPEQMRSAKDVNAQTDLWAIGIVLFELIAGKPPFVAETLPELVLQITADPPPSIRSFRPNVPAALEAVILRCLEKDRQRRYPNVAELALALLPFAPKRSKGSVDRISGIFQAAGLSTSALALPPSPQVQGTVASAGTSPPVTRTAPGVAGASSRTGIFVGLGLAGVLIVTGAGVTLLRKRAFAPSVVSIATPEPAASSVAAVSPSPSPLPPPPEITAPSAPLSTGSTSAAPVVADARQPARSTKPLSGPPSRPPTTPAAPSTRPSTPAPPLANCDPPFSLDDQGQRHYKPECYLNK